MSGIKYSGFLVSGISLSLDNNEAEACRIAATELKRAGVSPARLHFNIYKYSVDARKKNDIRLVYSVAARFDEPTEMPLPQSSCRRWDWRDGSKNILPLPDQTVYPCLRWWRI